MSFLEDILDVGSGVWDWATGSSTSAGVARAAALGYMLKEVQASINKDNEKSTKSSGGSSDSSGVTDYGVREQVDPDTNHSIPLVYGTAFLGGAVTDAVLSADNQTMWYCITICEQTGNLMSTNSPSVISFQDIWWNTTKIGFQSNGKTVASLTDDDGNVSTDMNGLVEFYFFSNGSDNPVAIAGRSQGNTLPAYQIFPDWTEDHTMDGLVFCLIKVTYSAEKNVTGLGTLEFKMSNTMKMPGDVLYDYMTNTRYGGGITPEEIYSE